MVCRNDALIFLCFSDWEHNSTRISHNTCFYDVLRISVSPLVPYSLILLVSDLLPAWGAVQFRSWLPKDLTHWGRVTHYCVGELTIIVSDNGLSPERRQAIIWTNAGILLIGPYGTNFSEISIELLAFSFTKMSLKVTSAKWRPFCLGLNVLTVYHAYCSVRIVSLLRFTVVLLIGNKTYYLIVDPESNVTRYMVSYKGSDNIYI